METILAVKDKFSRFYLGYVLLGLVGLLLLSRFWLPPGFTLVGHDSGLPIDAKKFLVSRFFAWDDRVGFGVDNSPLFGSTTLHFVDYLSSYLTGEPAGNWLNLFFWLSLLFFASTVFAYQFKDTLSKYFVFLFPPLVIFNFFIFQSLFILERAKYSSLIAVLFFLAIVFRLQAEKLKILPAAILSSLTFFLFNAGGLIALPLYGSVIVVVLTLAFFYLITGFTEKKFDNFFRFVLFLLLTGIGLVLLNTYQILPYIPGFLDKSYLLHLTSSVIQRSIDWVNYISQSTSFLNLFRLQGVPSWYSGINIVEASHPYARLYSENILFVLISFLFPVIAFSSLLLAKIRVQKKTLLFFALLTLVSMVFASGTHRPLGFLYGALYENFPGFAIFRTPYYKFAGALFIAISVLIATSLSIFVERVSKFNLLFSFLLIGLWLSYHYVLFDPDKILSWKEGQTTKIEIPGYVEEFRDWADGRDLGDKKILLTPPLNEASFIDGYTWGYWSLSPLPFVLTSQPVLVNELGLNNEERAWVQLLYGAFRAKDEEKVENIASRLGVGFILLRRDTLDARSTKVFEEAQESFVNIDKIKSFDKWDVYRLNKAAIPKVQATPSLTLIPEDSTYLAREFLDNEHTVVKENLRKTSLSTLLTKRVRAYSCQSCFIEQIGAKTSLPPVRIFPNSFLYFLKVRRDEALLAQVEDERSRIIAYLGIALRRVSEVRSMLYTEVERRYIISSLAKTSEYLDDALKLLDKNAVLAADYSFAKEVLDIVTPMEKSLQGFVETRKFTEQEKPLREEIYKILWIINGLDKLYAPILSDFDRLRSTKIYLFDYQKEGERDLYLNLQTLPADRNGGVLLPKAITYENGEKREVGLGERLGNWIKLEAPWQKEGLVRLTMDFDLPNLFLRQDSGLQLFSTGERGCHWGKMADFKPGQVYEVIIKNVDRAQELRIFFEDRKRIFRAEEFLHAEKGILVDPVETSVPYRHLYRSSPGSLDPTVYLCTNNKDTPDVESITVHEIYSPVLISVEKQAPTVVSQPEIEARKFNPTKYIVSMKGSEDPFVLLLNERYTPAWRFYRVGSEKEANNNFGWLKKRIMGKTEENRNHFIVDGYANAWLVAEPDESIWVIEYISQPLFYAGSMITMSSFVLLVGTAVYLKSRRKKA